MISREPPLMWPGYYAEAPGSGGGNGGASLRPDLGFKVSIITHHPSPSEPVVALRWALPIGRYFLKNVQQRQIVLGVSTKLSFPRMLGSLMNT